ncbi:MAG: hypothetical protein ABFD83_01430 [Armatimonadota bacterium]
MFIRVAVLSVAIAIISMPGWATLDPGILPCPAQDSVVVGQLDADVTGDGINDRVILMGRKLDNAGPYIVEMSIIVTDLDGKNELCTRLPKESDSGYDPQLKAMDFTGDGAPDVFISAPTGGSGGSINCIVYSFGGRQPKLLLDTNHTVKPAFTGHFLSDYKAQIDVDGKSSIIDLADRTKYYDEMGYYKNGKLLKSVEVWGGGYGLIAPVDADHNGVYELEAVQEVRGAANADRIAEIISHLKWEKGGWRVMNVRIKHPAK